MCLCGNEERMSRKLTHLDDAIVRRGTGKEQTILSEDRAKIIIDLIAVSVSFRDLICTVELLGEGTLGENSGICAQS